MIGTVRKATNSSAQAVLDPETRERLADEALEKRGQHFRRQHGVKEPQFIYHIHPDVASTDDRPLVELSSRGAAAGTFVGDRLYLFGGTNLADKSFDDMLYLLVPQSAKYSLNANKPTVTNVTVVPASFLHLERRQEAQLLGQQLADAEAQAQAESGDADAELADATEAPTPAWDAQPLRAARAPKLHRALIADVAAYTPKLKQHRHARDAMSPQEPHVAHHHAPAVVVVEATAAAEHERADHSFLEHKRKSESAQQQLDDAAVVSQLAVPKAEAEAEAEETETSAADSDRTATAATATPSSSIWTVSNVLLGLLVLTMVLAIFASGVIYARKALLSSLDTEMIHSLRLKQGQTNGGKKGKAAAWHSIPTKKGKAVDAFEADEEAGGLFYDEPVVTKQSKRVIVDPAMLVVEADEHHNDAKLLSF